MAASRKGRLSPITGAYAADTETVPITGGTQLCYYDETFNASEGFVTDEVICHGAANGRDMTAPAPAIHRATGGLTVPLDYNQLKFFLPMLMGPDPAPSEDISVTPSIWTRVFTSGLTTQQLAAFSLPVADDKFKLIQPAYLNTMSFNLAKQDGYRQMQLGFLTPDVGLVVTEPTFATASPVGIAHKKAPGVLGAFSIGGSLVAELVDGTFNYSNQGELTDLIDGQNKAVGLEVGDTLIRADLTMRIVDGLNTNDVIDNFQGPEGTPFVGQFSYVLDAQYSLVVDMPYCVGERRTPVIGGAQRQTFAASVQAFQDSGNPAATITLVNRAA